MKNTNRPQYTPSIQELRALIAVAEHGRVARAAEALNLTQSAVSRSIQSLEARLGVMLFTRHRKRLTPSDAGRAMVRDAAAILERLDHSARMVMAFGGRGQVLRLAALPTLAASWLVPKLAGFAAQHPDIAIDIGTTLYPVDFETAPYDAAIARASQARPHTESAPIMHERLIAVVAPKLAGSTAPDQILGLPLIQLATRPDLWSRWFARAAIDGAEALVGPRFDQFDTVMAAARAGMGAAIVPDIFVADDLALGRLVALTHEISVPSEPYVLITPAGREPSAALVAFRDWLLGVTGANNPASQH